MKRFVYQFLLASAVIYFGVVLALLLGTALLHLVLSSWEKHQDESRTKRDDRS